MSICCQVLLTKTHNSPNIHFAVLNDESRKQLPIRQTSPWKDTVVSIKRLLIVLLALVAGVAGVFTPGVAFADDISAVSADQAQQAVAGVPGLMADADTSAKSDGDSAAETAGLDVPRDASAGITLKGNGPTIKLTLPGAPSQRKAKKVAAGVAYNSGGGGFTNVVQPMKGQKGARVLNVIKNRQATEDFEYGLRQAPRGAHWQLAPDGGAFLIGADKNLLAAVAPPFAIDAKGNKLDAKYSVTNRGTVLVNHVPHRVAGVTYPVVADPALVWGWYKVDVQFNRRETNTLMSLGSGATFLVAWVPWPYGAALATVLGLYTSYANWAYNNGACMKFNVTYWGSVWASHYYGGNCR